MSCGTKSASNWNSFSPFNNPSGSMTAHSWQIWPEPPNGSVRISSSGKTQEPSPVTYFGHRHVHFPKSTKAFINMARLSVSIPCNETSVRQDTTHKGYPQTHAKF